VRKIDLHTFEQYSMNQHYRARDNQSHTGLFHQGQLLDQQDMGQLLPTLAILKAQVKAAGWGGRPCSEWDGFVLSLQKIKDNIKNTNAEKLHCKFIHVSRT